MTGSAIVLRADAHRLPLPDESVDLIVTSPPYFGQRSYSDGGEHYEGQIGSEPHPREWLEALWAVTAECWRVLKPSGSMFVNLGDKRSGSGAPGTTSGLTGRRVGGTPIPGQARPFSEKSTLQGNGHVGGGPKYGSRSHTSGSAAGSTLEGSPQQRARVQGERSGGLTSYTRAAFGRAKSKQLLPQRYAIGCEDGLSDPEGVGWIVRQEIVWSKPNGLPESVTDRCRDAHEPWWHLVKQGDYFAAIDELREPHSENTHARRKDGQLPPKEQAGLDAGVRNGYFGETTFNPLGKLPSSVWTIPTEPLQVPEHLGVDHFAAFPSEWPRRLILGWSPAGICSACGEGRRPVAEVVHEKYRDSPKTGRPHRQDLTTHTGGWNAEGYVQTRTSASIVGYRCACGEAPTLDAFGPVRPAVVLDPFGGTGTTAMVARALGRRGVSVDLSHDYSRLARWRVFESDGARKVEARTNAGRQGSLL